jgi:hypothetical protein
LPSQSASTTISVRFETLTDGAAVSHSESLVLGKGGPQKEVLRVR